MTGVECEIKIGKATITISGAEDGANILIPFGNKVLEKLLKSRLKNAVISRSLNRGCVFFLPGVDAYDRAIAWAKKIEVGRLKIAESLRERIGDLNISGLNISENSVTWAFPYNRDAVEFAKSCNGIFDRDTKSWTWSVWKGRELERLVAILPAIHDCIPPSAGGAKGFDNDFDEEMAAGRAGKYIASAYDAPLPGTKVYVKSRGAECTVVGLSKPFVLRDGGGTAKFVYWRDV